MKVLIVHVSDIHTTEDHDLQAVFAAISPAVRNLTSGIELCVLAISGDIAFSGLQEQYIVAMTSVVQLRDQLAADLQMKVQVAIIPGNHDCHFADSPTVRDRLLDSLAANPGSSLDQSTTEVLIEVQRNFFDFRDAFQENSSEARGNALAYSYAFPSWTDPVVVFKCINSAVSSRLKEQPGKLTFPVSEVVETQVQASLVVSMIHHPYNWFVPSVGRRLRESLEQLSDVILTGHEHEFAARSTRGSRGETNIYIEGGALDGDESNPQPEFNALLVDTSLRRQKLYRFAYDDQMFFPILEPKDWEDFQVNRLRTRKTLVVADGFRRWLEDLGVTLNHPSGKALSIDDVFVYPDLREVKHQPHQVANVLGGEQIVSELLQSHHLLVTGSDRCGKTTFAKRLFLDLLEQGLAPLYLVAGESHFHGDDRMATVLLDKAEEIYGAESRERYRQMPRGQKVVMVDDYQRMRLKGFKFDDLVRELSSFAEYIVFMSGDVTHHVLELVGTGQMTEGKDSFKHFRILPFGHVRRNQLAEKWIALDDEAVGDPEIFSRKLLDIKRITDTAIGRNFVPAYPVFVLPMLQTYGHSEPVDLSASTYGYFYELLIRRALANASTKESLDVKLSYLSHCAFAMLTSHRRRLTDSEFREIHRRYELSQMIDLSYSALHADLIRCGVMESDGDECWFKYSYYYYYFVASYLRDHVTEPDSQALIREFAARLHDEDNANILLFLAHLSKHPTIIDELLAAAGRVFPDVPRIELKDGETSVALVEESLKEFVFEDRGPDGRRAVFASMDELDRDVQRQVGEEQGEEDELYEYIEQVGAAFKNLQIIGQILKNFPGSLDGAQKVRLLQVCYDIGLRTLGSLFNTVVEHREELVKDLAAAFREVDPQLSQGEVADRVRESVANWLHASTYGTIRRIAMAVGSPALFKVYEAVAADRPDDATSLITAALRLDQMRQFPEHEVLDVAKALRGNVLASSVLRSCVILHFHLFDVKFTLKQRMCEKLSISYRRFQGVGGRTKLLSSGTTSGKTHAKH